MANVIKKAANKFTKGLIMDFSPENTKNEVLTHALNATLLTFNGNEMSLQNDMGNARVETAYLPKGYIPVGTCEYGGIIYIVSYNPLEDKSLIGCFPSPERNVSSDELGMLTTLTNLDFLGSNGIINNSSLYVLLRNDKLNPGDKFLIYANEELYEEKLENLETNSLLNYEKEKNPILALNIVSIEDSGKITYLDSSIKKYEVTKTIKDGFINKIVNYRYHILGRSNVDQPLNNQDLDDYRNVLSSGYSVFKAKTSGKLAILAELIMIDSYSVTHKIEEVKDSLGQTIPDKYHITLYPEISCSETEQKYGITPKLSYYYLEESDGILQLSDVENEEHTFLDNNTNKSYKSLVNSPSFYDTKLKNIFGYEIDKLNGQNLSYIYNEYYPNDKVAPFNLSKPNTYHSKNIYNKDELNSILLGTVILPNKVLDNTISLSLQLPFTYKYKIIPCMSYGKLENLAVANTIDFSNINNFSASEFNVWKYRVDGPTVHLLFGAEIYDTSLDDNNKVQALVLEFYDLWGFAGSIIIDSKKAYSGVFTKILTLNTMHLLSSNKIPYISEMGKTITGKYTNTYQRHKNIVQTWDTSSGKKISKYYLNDTEIELVDQEQGWRDLDGNDIENDCGTLYQNLIYGVKAYFVLDNPNDDETKVFTLKNLFFMFTNPLFNNYYYTENNFNRIQNPELDFVIASRIKDTSNKESLSYNNGNLIINNGYKSGSKIEEYIKGSSTETNILDTKYYKYKGTSELQVEIGLKNDYNDIGLMYDRKINKYFGCTLELVNNDNTATWSLESDSTITDLNVLLNYIDDDLKNDPTLNSLSFNGNNTFNIPVNTFLDYHFLDPNDQSGKAIPISYEFVVGYAITIENIRLTQMPATTVCALCHKRDDGTYNYDDFGIEEGINSDGNPIYFSSTIFYNSGTNDDVHFGLCRQLNSTGNVLTQCSRVDSSDYDAVKIHTPRILNCGDSLKAMLPYIGKLSFCEPHISGFSESNGVSISPYNGSLYINPDLSKYANKPSDHNSTFGIVPSNELYKNPLYLLCANTKNMISRLSEFVVNMQRINENINNIYVGYTGDNDDIPEKFNKSVNALRFIGLKGLLLTDYNKKLLETMKGVYAYNPDYNSMYVRVGDVSILDNKVRFMSNIICKDAVIDFSTDNISLNDLVSIGSMSLANYFDNLQDNSEIVVKDLNNSWIPQLNFVPNIYYCGGNNNKVLTNSLTYNTPDTLELYNELTFNSDRIVVRHNDGSISYTQGDLNTKALYGYKHPYLLQLDVSNYKIDYNGHLSLKEFKTINQPYKLTIDDINLKESLSNNGYDKQISLPNGELITINIKFEVTDGNNTGILKKSDIIDPEHLFLLIDTLTDLDGTNPIANLNMNITIIDKGDYEIQFSKESFKIKLELGTAFLTKDYNSSILLGYSDEVLLDHLRTLSYLNNLGLLGRPCIDNSYILEKADNSSYPLKIILLDKNVQEVNYALIPNSSGGITYLMSLYINDIYFTITTTENTNLEEGVHTIIPTLNYYLFSPNDYIVDFSLYPDTFIRGTNITLNDLTYEPNINGHRLYMRQNCFKYFGDPRARLYYRTLTPDKNSNISTTWKGDTDYYNMLFINTGPCFIPDNLS